MNVLITYDVSTETAAGRKRLRKVALVCKDFGQRVQKSVFECSITEMQYEEVMRRLLDLIEEKEDSLRVYRLIEPKEKYVQTYGVNTAVDFEEPLVL
ncbi:MAG: CRISPR-associated endonuclease Cas2 [Nitrospira sp.]|nr:CRISPR-associated endonuclease Cas2 [Nitrospira sp.]